VTDDLQRSDRPDAWRGKGSAARGRWRAVAQWLRSLRRSDSNRRQIPEAQWHQSIAPFPFLASLPEVDRTKLKLLAEQFLTHKEFHGAGGLEVTDEMAIAIAAQACLPLLKMRAWPGKRVLSDGSVLDWYGDFVGIVVHAGEVVARRERVDEVGVVHHYNEVLAGEAMERGPVMLSWSDVANAGDTAERGYNVVIHEFAHKIDMADGAADGCPWLWPGFMGHGSADEARRAWLATWRHAHEAFCERVLVADRFGGPEPWLDPYGAQSLDEFFAVACEAYFVNRQKFGGECGSLSELLDAFFLSGR
jgi:Mlc titration factor MtfA (ptsG expression regulator)